MSGIEWSERFSVGVPMLDDQHKGLIEIINSMQNEVDASTMFDVVMKMFNYAAVHFDTEEKLMRSRAYPQLDQQVREHKAFLAKATEFSALDFSKAAVCAQVESYLCEWLTHHILEVDMQYRNRL